MSAVKGDRTYAQSIRRYKMLRVGSTIRPNPVGDHDPAFASGWSAADEAGFAWIEGAAADLEFSLSPVLDGIEIEIDCFSVELSGASPQRLTVYGNGAYIGTYMVRSRGPIRVPLTRDMCSSRTIRLSLVPAEVQIPKLVGRNGDERALSIGVYSIALINAKKKVAA
jgi:hypothetical protein